MKLATVRAPEVTARRSERPLGAITYKRARHAATIHTHDSVGSHVNDLLSVLDMEVIRSPRFKGGVDSLGGAASDSLAPIAERYGIDIELVNDTVDPTFGFRSLDWDGRVRMDG